MSRAIVAGLAMALPLLAGCRGCVPGEPNFGGGYEETGSDVTETGETGDDTAPADDTGEDTGDWLDEPGDVVEFEADNTTTEVELSDLSGDSNKDQDIYLLLVNPSDSELTFHLSYKLSDGPDEEEADDTAARMLPPAESGSDRGLSPYRAKLRQAVREGRLVRDSSRQAYPAPPELTDADIGVTEQNFWVRSSLQDETEFLYRPATLWALGDSVAIWVDQGTGIDWDYECDGVVDVVASEPEAYGFDNCDLKTIADIVDTNIIPNVRSVFGEESDVNGDGRVNVLITPVLNEMTLAAEDEDDRAVPMWSYADPEIDLNEWDPTENPYSNYQEVLFVFAPDPGLFNPLASVDVDEYTSMSLAAQIARAFQNLVSYNNHVIRWESEPEEAWLREGLGAMAADITGFGAVFYASAWDYVDATHLDSLVSGEDVGAISTSTWGPQYLFLRYLVDNYGTEILGYMVDTNQVGTDNVAGAVSVAAGQSLGFDKLVLDWQIALLTTGVADGEGNPLVDVLEYPYYQAGQFVEAPTSDPESGDLFGANGYQTGITVGGTNYFMEGGTTDDPKEVEANRVKLGNTDFLTMSGSLNYSGVVTGKYGAAVVRLVDIGFDTTELVITASDSNYYGAVMRWWDPEDPDVRDYKVESIISATDQTDMELPELPDDGTPIYALGNIRDSGTTLVAGESETEEATVYDTDRYLLDLTSRSGKIDVAVKLERHYEGDDPALYDPWVGVVPRSWLPAPTEEGIARSDECTDGIDFQYPGSVLKYLYYQIFLSSDAYSDSSFDPCGEPSGDTGEGETSCADDWDRDGVLDEDEPLPTCFIQQVWVMQCTLAGGDKDGFEPADASYIDVDELDDDDTPYFDRTRNLGGRMDDSGEEAFVKITLEGGEQYLVIVGGGSDTGPYELTIQQINTDG